MKYAQLSLIDLYLCTCYPYYDTDLFICIVFLKPIELWTGKQLFSVLVRPNAHTKVFLNLTVKEKNYTIIKEKNGGKKKEKENENEKGKEWEKFPQEKREWESMCPGDGYVYFRNSELLSGQVGKATLGENTNDCFTQFI
jgi:DNA-directed RNA polymerase III subunit RPC1